MKHITHLQNILRIYKSYYASTKHIRHLHYILGIYKTYYASMKHKLRRFSETNKKTQTQTF